jgi:hypothetical protein
LNRRLVLDRFDWQSSVSWYSAFAFERKEGRKEKMLPKKAFEGISHEVVVALLNKVVRPAETELSDSID